MQDDFTNAQMTGFDEPFKDNTPYTVLTLGYDKYGVACSMSKAEFTTPKKPLVWKSTDKRRNSKHNSNNN